MQYTISGFVLEKSSCYELSEIYMEKVLLLITGNVTWSCVFRNVERTEGELKLDAFLLAEILT